ncbi:hypothetical protein C0Q70_19067 [Pomacea canaliculata]|uniref:Homeobox domain-containing protein n=1 Tax=Pomacea canaliculata TaxID=400727 RepID=A0A2T7NIA6_POMCA|nr:hypothetical protein C0Q70_19067 [Pomacea canaliculata]
MHFDSQTSPGVSLFCGEGRPYLANAPLGQRLCLCPVSHEGPHSHLSASGGVLSGGLKPLATHPNTAVPPGHDASAFYPPLFRGLPVRPELTTLTSGGPRLPFDPAMAAHPYGLLYAGLDVNGLGMRKAATRETTGPLKAWLHEHRKNPYPTKAEKIMLAIITKMTLTQVSTWFANARRRLKKESRLYTVKDGAHDDSDHNPRDRDDDDDANETDDDCGLLRGCTDSDEDINVDVSDISDHEDDPVTPTATSASTSSPMGKHSPLSSSPMGKHSPLSSSSPHTSFTSSPPFVANRIPFFLYTSGISPAMALHGVPNGVAHGNSCSTQATFSKTLSPAVIAQPSIPLGAAATAPSTAAARSSSSVVQSSRPKIWSISEIIHSESERTSATGSAAKVSESDRKNDRTKDDDVSRDRSTWLQPLALDQQPNRTRSRQDMTCPP